MCRVTLLCPALKINCGPPTANLWSDWSPQKRVNRDKLDQRQNVRKSRFYQQFCLWHHSPPEITTQNLWNLSLILTDLSISLRMCLNFQILTDFSLVVLIINMLLRRVELGFRTPQKKLKFHSASPREISNFSVVFEPNSKFHSLQKDVYSTIFSVSNNLFQFSFSFSQHLHLHLPTMQMELLSAEKDEFLWPWNQTKHFLIGLWYHIVATEVLAQKKFFFVYLLCADNIIFI